MEISRINGHRFPHETLGQRGINTGTGRDEYRKWLTGGLRVRIDVQVQIKEVCAVGNRKEVDKPSSPPPRPKEKKGNRPQRHKHKPSRI